MLDAQKRAAAQALGTLLVVCVSGTLLLVNRLIWLTGLSAVSSDTNQTVLLALQLIAAVPWWLYLAFFVPSLGILLYNNWKAFSILNDYKPMHAAVVRIEESIENLRDQIQHTNLCNRDLISELWDVNVIRDVVRPYFVKLLERVTTRHNEILNKDCWISDVDKLYTYSIVANEDSPALRKFRDKFGGFGRPKKPTPLQPLRCEAEELKAVERDVRGERDAVLSALEKIDDYLAAPHSLYHDHCERDGELYPHQIAAQKN